MGGASVWPRPARLYRVHVNLRRATSLARVLGCGPRLPTSLHVPDMNEAGPEILLSLRMPKEIILLESQVEALPGTLVLYYTWNSL